MREDALGYVACPVCKGSLDIDTVEERENAHIMRGTLRCLECSHTYPIMLGVPHLLPSTVHSRDLAVGEAYAGYYSLVVPDSPREDGVLYGKTIEEEILDFQSKTGIDDLSLLEGKIFLDAGCGLARMEGALSRYCTAVLAFDISPSVLRAFTAWKDLPNIHVVRGDLTSAPIPSGKFDFVWCDGALPYVSDLPAAVMEILRARSPAGFLYSWCYGARFTLNHFLGRIFHATRLPVRARFPLIYAVGIFVKIAHSIKRRENMLKNVSRFAQGVLDASLAAQIHHVSEAHIRALLLSSGLAGEGLVRVETKGRRVDFWVGSLSS